MKFFIKTFGCQMNEHDSELIAGILIDNGYEQTFDMTVADIIIANTCCIRESAENHIWGFIGNVKHLKKANKNMIVAMVGCMSQQESIREDFKHKGVPVNILLGTYQQHRLPEYIARIMAGEKRIIDISEDNRDFPDVLPSTRGNSLQAQVNIIYGCNNFCAYCIVPYVRGRERSRDFQAIVDEVRDLAAAGYKEIMLLGQNVNSYGKDFAGGSPSFGDLLVELNKIAGVERIRYMSPHPRDFSLELVDLIAGLDKVCDYYHLPLQAGCDKTLTAMNRGYDTKTFMNLVEHIREVSPEATISTDLIVGFPNESEADFQEFLDFMAKCRFEICYTFMYSKRSGTAAAKFDGQISELEKKARLKRLLAVQNPISYEINQGYIGKTVKVLVEGKSKSNEARFTGRTEGNKVVIFDGEEGHIGKIVEVYIQSVKTWYLEGEIVNI